MDLPNHISGHEEPLVGTHVGFQDNLPRGRIDICDDFKKLHLVVIYYATIPGQRVRSKKKRWVKR
jgi:hypothetical protein